MRIPTVGRLATVAAALAVSFSVSIPAALAQDAAADHPEMDEATHATMEAAMQTMSHDKIAGLLEGKGMGAAKAAEKNGYPGPKHVLELDDKLELTDAQKDEVTGIFTAAQADFRTLGKQVVEAEAAMNMAFADGTITDADLLTFVMASAEAQGMLRARHLAAHMATRTVLTDEQVSQYVELRSAMGGHGKMQGQGMKHGAGMGQGQGQGAMKHGQGQCQGQDCKMMQGAEGDADADADDGDDGDS
jgi:hypothetical protein